MVDILITSNSQQFPTIPNNSQQFPTIRDISRYFPIIFGSIRYYLYVRRQWASGLLQCQLYMEG